MNVSHALAPISSQTGDFDNWLSPTGRRFEDLGNGWQVGYDMMWTIIGNAFRKGEESSRSYYDEIRD